MNHIGSQEEFRRTEISPPFITEEEIELTLGEMDNQLQSIVVGPGENDEINDNSSLLSSWLHKDGVIYPHIMVPYLHQTLTERSVYEDSARIKSVARRPESKTLWLRLLSLSTHLSTFFHSSDSSPFLLEHAPPESHPVTAFSWHNYLHVCAIALRNNTIHFYDLAHEQWSKLQAQHEFQTSIAAISWQPNQINKFAVACARGICLWSLISQSPDRENCCSATGEKEQLRPLFGSHFPGMWMNFLTFPGHFPVTSLEYSPSGQFLISGAPSFDGFIIWDIALESPCPIRRLGGTTLLKWSPSGNFLFQGTNKNIFRIWETRLWTCEKWTSFDRPVATACWNDQDSLLFSLRNDNRIHCITMLKQKQKPSMECTYTVVAVLTPHTKLTKRGMELGVGGNINEMVWDKEACRLAISFAEDPGTPGSELIALFSSSIVFSVPTLSLKGFIRGPRHGVKPYFLSFVPFFSRGALLSCVWVNGKISLFPMYYQ